MDLAFYARPGVPQKVLDKMDFKLKLTENAGGFIKKWLVRWWMKGKTLEELIKFVGSKRPKDVLTQQAKVRNAEGLAFGALGIPGFKMSIIDIFLQSPQPILRPVRDIYKRLIN